MDTATKRGGRRLHSALSDRAVKAATASGRLFDGHGLFLFVTPGGAKCWKQRITVNERRQELGLGPYPVVTLREAREAALANLRMVRAGLNPKVERRRARGIPTFAELARADFEHRRAGWRNAKHAEQWIRTLEEFAFPRLGERTVDDITTDDVFGVLSSIWHTKPTTAKRLRQRIAAVLSVAVAKGHRSDNPADTVKAMLAKHQSVATKGHRSLAYGDVAGALAKVRASQAWTATRHALEFLVLTVARAGEVRFATWREIDIELATWTVPAERMKTGREHRVPLSPRALEILVDARALRPGRTDLVFPSRAGKPLPERTFVQVLDSSASSANAPSSAARSTASPSSSRRLRPSSPSTMHPPPPSSGSRRPSRSSTSSNVYLHVFAGHNTRAAALFEPVHVERRRPDVRGCRGPKRRIGSA